MTHDLVERLREMGSIKASALYSQRKTLNGAADKLEAYMAEIAALRAEKEEIRKGRNRAERQAWLKTPRFPFSTIGRRAQ